MKLNFNSILLSTENKDKLVKFYSEVFEKKPEMEDENYAGFSAGSSFLSIGFHDKIKGRAPNPDRILLNFESEDVKGEFERIKKIDGARVVKEPYEPAPGYWIGTIADPDGNYFQVVSPWDEDAVNEKMKPTNPITVEAVVNAPLEKVWDAWTSPEHITKWAFASDDWEAPHAENDVKTGGKFLTRMQSKDGKEGFDFTGEYTNVKENELIEYDMDDGRHVSIKFEQTPEGVKVIETFDPETENTEELQRSGWQSILNNFRKYAEGQI